MISCAAMCRRLMSSYSIQTATKTAGVALHQYDITTEDGYKLTLHRLGEQGKKDNFSHQTPVLLQHGMWSSSENWIAQGPNHALGYILMSAGFDVWLGNTRGNVHSRLHTRLKSEDKKYWDFSWHEMGVFDLPTMIDRVLETTGRRQIYYFGHSQGTTAFFVMSSERPEYNNKVRTMFALAPVAFLDNMKSVFLRAASVVSSPILSVFQAAGFYKFFPDRDVVEHLNKWWKNNPTLPDSIARVMMTELSSYPTEHVSKNMRDVLLAHISSGASSKCVAHYGQCIRNGFRKFDHGADKNRLLYGEEEPPEYNLKNMTVPVVAFVSDGDWLSCSSDVTKLMHRIGSETSLERIKDPRFNHQDFIWADLAKYQIIYKIFSYLLHYGKIV